MVKKGDLFRGYTIENELVENKNVFLISKPPNNKFFLKCVLSGIVSNELKVGLRLGSKCPYLVKIIDILYGEGDDKMVYVIMEYFEEGDLSKRMEKKGRATETELYRFLFESSHAILALHEEGIIHQGIDARKFFLSKEGGYKLGGYGFKHVFDFPQKSETRIGKIGYASPEIMRRYKQYSNKCDVYSLGVVVLEFTLGRHPYSNDDGTLDPARAAACDPIPAALKHPHPCAKLALRMIAEDPDARPTACEVLATTLPALGPLHTLCVETAAQQREITRLQAELLRLQKEAERLRGDREAPEESASAFVPPQRITRRSSSAHPHPSVVFGGGGGGVVVAPPPPPPHHHSPFPSFTPPHSPAPASTAGSLCSHSPGPVSVSASPNAHSLPPFPPGPASPLPSISSSSSPPTFPSSIPDSISVSSLSLSPAVAPSYSLQSQQAPLHSAGVSAASTAATATTVVFVPSPELQPEAWGWSAVHRAREIVLSNGGRTAVCSPVSTMGDDKAVSVAALVGEGKYVGGVFTVTMKLANPHHYLQSDGIYQYSDDAEVERRIAGRDCIVGVFAERPVNFSQFSSYLRISSGFYYSMKSNAIYSKKDKIDGGVGKDVQMGDVFKLEVDIPRGDMDVFINDVRVAGVRSQPLLQNGVFVVGGMHGFNNVFPEWTIESVEFVE